MAGQIQEMTRRNRSRCINGRGDEGSMVRHAQLLVLGKVRPILQLVRRHR